MANYPSFGQLDSSQETIQDGLLISRASNGAARGRSLYAAKKRGFTVAHNLSAADKATLETFYDTNKALSVTFVWAGDSVSRTCIFPSPPKFTPLAGPRWEAEVALEEV